MPISFSVLPRIGLVFVTYTGVAGLQETVTALQGCAQAPEFRPWFSHLVDLRAVTDYERDVLGFFEMQARALDILPELSRDRFEFRIVFLAPDGPGRKMAEMVRRTWEGLGHVLVLIAEDEESAMDLLGLPRIPLDQLAAQGV